MNKYYPHLFSPIKVGNLTLKSRLMASPLSLFDLDASPEHKTSLNDKMIYKLRAAGGAAVVTIGDSIVHPSGNAEGLNSDKINIYMHRSIAFLRDITDEIHRYGAYANIELNHDGARGAWPDVDGWGVSDLIKDNGGHVIEMNEEMIAEVVEGFGVSAANAKAAGFDMVMIHAGHGWLLGQFLSPYWNHRTDRFGGSLENRARIVLMVIDSIRRHCGKDFPIEVRLSGDEAMPDGLPGITIEESIAFAKMIDGKVDLIHVSAGNNNFGPSEMISHPSMFHEHGVNVKYARSIKPYVKTPVVTVGALADPQMMEDIIASGAADLVAVGRALLADPDLPEKARHGLAEDIRPCLRCWRCLGEGVRNGAIRCSVNPELGRAFEHFYPKAPTPAKKVLVAGGGPGGMQAALTAAQRGHQVILCEKEGELGGTIRYCEGIDFKADMDNYKNYLIRQVFKAGVEVRLNTEVTPELVAEVAPDHLIAAVGADPIVPPIPGIEHAQGLLDIYLQKLPVGDNIVIIGGGLSGVEAAIEFSQMGKKAIVLEMGPDYVPDCNFMHRLCIEIQLEKYKIDIRLNTKCVGIAKDKVTCEDDQGKTYDLPADTVLYATGMRSRAALVDSLRDSCDEFRWIGDCRKVAQVQEAVIGGYDAAMTI